MEYETVWNGGQDLTGTLDRDYAALLGDGWDLIYVPPSPLTTPWDSASAFAQPDPDAFVKTALVKRPKRQRQRRAAPIAKDWSRTYAGIHQIGRGK